MLSTVIGGISIAGMAIAALAYLARSLTVHFLDRDLRAYEIGLKAAADRELESLKAQLSLAGREREIVLAAMHQKRLEIIAELYARIDDANGALNNLAGPVLRGEDPTNEATSKYSKALSELHRYYGKHTIWLEPDTAQAVFEFFANAAMPAVWLSPETFGDSLAIDIETLTPDVVRDRVRAAQTEAIELRARLESDFRRLMGVLTESQLAVPVA